MIIIRKDKLKIYLDEKIVNFNKRIIKVISDYYLKSNNNSIKFLFDPKF